MKLGMNYLNYLAGISQEANACDSSQHPFLSTTCVISTSGYRDGEDTSKINTKGYEGFRYGQYPEQFSITPALVGFPPNVPSSRYKKRIGGE